MTMRTALAVVLCMVAIEACGTERDLDAVFATVAQLRAALVVGSADPFFGSRA